jgi:hypothetical protein
MGFKIAGIIFVLSLCTIVAQSDVEKNCDQTFLRCRGRAFCCANPAPGKGVKCGFRIPTPYCHYFDLSKTLLDSQENQNDDPFSQIKLPELLCNSENEVKVFCPVMIRLSSFPLCCPKPPSNQVVSCHINRCSYNNKITDENKGEFFKLLDEYPH